MGPLSAEELTKKIFDATEFLRSRLDALRYLDLVSNMVLLKWASDQPEQLEMPESVNWADIVASGDSSPREALSHALGALLSGDVEFPPGLLWDFDFAEQLDPRDARQLIRQFDDISLKPEDLKFEDVVGQAYDQVLGEFADVIGKRAGGFYTPRSVIQLMVRLARPEPGHSVSDPFAGSGGTLTHAAEYVEERTGLHGTLTLYPQDRSDAACKMACLNLLFHGLSPVNVRSNDTLARPYTTADYGLLRKFDRILTVPPFSANYRREEVKYPETMMYGWPPENARKADLVFVQHVLATLRPAGIGVMVTPHGVLFRGGAEGEIRRRLVKEGRLQAVIGIGPNVFHGTNVPACVLVLRGPTHEPDRGVLFINAEREITTGRSRNYLDPRHVEKIVTTFRSWRNIPHFSKVVSIDEIAQNDFNLNIRRYVDTNPTVRVRLDSHALLFGGVPKAEVEAQRDRFRAFGIDIADLFADEGKDHLGIPSDGSEAIAERISALAAASEQRFLEHLRDWFQFEGRSPLAHLSAPHETRRHLMNSFRNNLLAAGILDEHQLTGVFADWWAAHRDDLRELANASRHDTLAPAANAKLRKTIPNSLEEDLTERAKKLVLLARQELVETYRSWVDRYGTSLQELHVRRAESEDRLRWRLRHLGYDWPFDR